MESLHLFELNLIKAFQEIRNPFLDSLFKFFNLFDTGYFIFFIVPIIWMGINWKWGVRLLYILFLSFFFNDLFKMLFHQPRPFNLDPSVAVIHVKGFGFPSGAAQSATIYLGLLLLYCNNKKLAWILGLTVFLGMSISRVYLGLHFFSDLLGGYILGVFLLLIFYYLFPRFENLIKRAKSYQIILVSLIFSILMFQFKESYIVRPLSITSFSVTIGLLLSKKYNLLLPTSSSFWEGLLKILFTWIGMGLIVLLFKFSFSNMNSFSSLSAIIFLGLWLSLLMSFFWKNSFGRLTLFKH